MWQSAMIGVVNMLDLLAPAIGFAIGVICAGAIYQDVLRATQLENKLMRSMILRLSNGIKPRKRDGKGRFVR